jgi:hypothetical protein
MVVFGGGVFGGLVIRKSGFTLFRKALYKAIRPGLRTPEWLPDASQRAVLGCHPATAKSPFFLFRN